eukprot:g882.t1
MGVTVEDRQFGGYIQRVQRACGRCRGQGVQAKNRCGSCKGHGFVKEQVELPITVPPGCPDRKRFIFRGKADEDMLLRMPQEALLHVLRHLAVAELARSAAGAKGLRQASWTPELWRLELGRRYGKTQRRLQHERRGLLQLQQRRAERDLWEAQERARIHERQQLVSQRLGDLAAHGSEAGPLRPRLARRAGRGAASSVEEEAELREASQRLKAELARLDAKERRSCGLRRRGGRC